MSNDLALLIKNNPALIGAGLDEDTLAVAGSSNGNKRISIKGGVFRKMVGGKEVGAIEDRHMNIIFVKMSHKASRTYYDQGYKEGTKVAPVCWSQDSETPSVDVKNPPASTCKTCQFSIKGSGLTGLGTACRLSWRTAVVLPSDPSGDIMQLVIPARSCFGDEVDGKYPFRPYIQMLATNNISAGRVVTKMQFDTKSPTPKLIFSAAAVVPADDIPKVLAQSKSAPAENAIKLTVFQQDEDEVAGEAHKGPQLFKEDKPETTAATPDVSDMVKKWAKKKGS